MIPLEIKLPVNASDEEARSYLSPEEVERLLASLATADGLRTPWVKIVRRLCVTLIEEWRSGKAAFEERNALRLALFAVRPENRGKGCWCPPTPGLQADDVHSEACTVALKAVGCVGGRGA